MVKIAGNYPDVPDHRMALDKDGSQIYNMSSSLSAINQISSGDVITINDETNSMAGPYATSDGSQYMVVFFPELRDIAGVYTAALTGNQTNGGMGSCVVSWSADTANGVDGTWTQIASFAPASGMSPAWRSGITAAVCSGARALRFSYSNLTFAHLGLIALHIYGHIHTGENPDRLAIWQPSVDAQVGPAYLDWGVAARNSVADVTFRVKNLSSTLTASTITGSCDTLADTTPAVAAQHTLSLNGTTFTSTITVPDLAPGAISGVLTLRRTTPSNAVLSLWTTRLNMVAASWA